MKSTEQVIVFLNPGEYFVGDARHRIRTLLGSCVSITLWHPAQRIGAMSHFLLSERSGKVGEPLDARYGKEALGLMLMELAKQGVDPKACQAKIFGGGDMFPKQSGMANASNVGRKNGEAAHRLLEAHDISVMSESLFGQGHRRILFDVSSGHVWSRQVKPVDAT
ncbi:chemotaxis protein CheD [Aquabacterium sp.]|uniref:chemotaxis protein CheD n=1 Tax=Aquabacterium sp. TaxID=1872578 RepID=UPI003D6DA61C